MESALHTVTEPCKRLDQLLKSLYPKYSRTYFQQLIEDQCVLINGQPTKKRAQPQIGDEIDICFRLTPELELKPENIPLDILFEDEHILAINKPAGMVVHPAPGHPTNTFANALLYHCQNLEQTGDPLRPGIVHRLDKETSGVLIAAKTAQSHAKLVELFASRSMEKTYLALCSNNPGSGGIDAPIGRHSVHRQQMTITSRGKMAITDIHSIPLSSDTVLVVAKPLTGRTHQIRVHLKSRHAPVLGDKLYGTPNQKYNRHLLHAWRLKFTHPITAQEMCFTAPIPDDMSACHSVQDLL